MDTPTLPSSSGAVSLTLGPWTWKLLCASPLVDPDCKRALHRYEDRDGRRVVEFPAELVELLREEIRLWKGLSPLVGGRTLAMLEDVERELSGPRRLPSH